LKQQKATQLSSQIVCLFIARTNMTEFLFWFLFCCGAATQLALQVQQERTQVVCSNKDARKSLAEALPQWTMDLMANAYTCTQIKEK